ncbi:long-chain fatty acid--CoA ligase [Streptomonospora sp. S1-112]|uniref:Long-chain fatty acid--CoA ligase n=1 Tax=Streptomonospora mangrovi TaxID=2883123 RepID=A0A9X3NKN3_9ACTN|nr:long-chain fatty acid--CoA ligase [Streptomonospora mangrovi]MDA0565247.1 long-chain fatty acid--CoA ligase [Streptomonospora mangrovi]
MYDLSVASWAERRARRTPHRTALVHRDSATCYSALYDRARRLARVLGDRGVGRGDRVAFLGPNQPAFFTAFFATGLLGAVFVPLNTRLAPPETAFVLADCGARLLLHTGPAPELPAPSPPPMLRLDTSGTVDPPDLAEPPAPSPAPAAAGPVSPETPCVVLYTSGTSGRPKGAVLTHANLTWNAVNVLVDTDLTAGEVALVAAPLFHAGALGMLALPVLLKGGTCVLMDAFDPGEAIRVIERHRVTAMFGVPTMYRRLADHPAWPRADLSSLRTPVCGGAPVPADLAAAYARRGLPLRWGYGLTEAGPGVLLAEAARADGAGADGPGADPAAALGGVPHMFTDVRVVRPDLTDAPPGETGELLARGPNVMAGYWRREPESAAAFASGWLRTGDAARAAPDGTVRVVDRVKEVIISGGENVYPAEVELALLRHPDVADCAVIGVPDPEWGEVGRAVLVAAAGSRLDPARVLASLSGRIAAYKIPRSAVVAPALPRNGAGKLDRRAVEAGYGAAAPDAQG